LRAPDSLAPALERALRARQAERLPSVAAAVVRGGDVIWSGAVGTASYDDGAQATPETQYRIGSITKTFTATAVMQLRDAGLLDLDDRLDEHLAELPSRSPTIRRLLAHLSGFQREVGEMWVTGDVPTIEDVLAAVETYELVLPEARAHHYSNLAYAFLGELVARRSGMRYEAYVDERILAPLRLVRTTWQPQAPHAQGYLVDEYAGTAHREPHTELGGAAAMGQLWSNVIDLCTWATFLARGRDGVLDAATVDEMWFPQVLVDPEQWDRGWGLGLELLNREARVFGGHGGGMPGHLASVYVQRASGVGAAVLTNAGTRGETAELALELATATIEQMPPEIEPWRPEADPPAEVLALLGRWWSEGSEFVFAWERDRLRARIVGATASMRDAVFERVDGGFRVASGRERGERLRVDGDRLVWAGYVFTRSQQPFGEPSPASRRLPWSASDR
jgi:CubicO group peptidase (beta-lactamase class C family)